MSKLGKGAKNLDFDIGQAKPTNKGGDEVGRSGDDPTGKGDPGAKGDEFLKEQFEHSGAGDGAGTDLPGRDEIADEFGGGLGGNPVDRDGAGVSDLLNPDLPAHSGQSGVGTATWEDVPGGGTGDGGGFVPNLENGGGGSSYEETQDRIVELMDKFLGEVESGESTVEEITPAFEQLDQWRVDNEMRHHPENVFVLERGGDSMASVGESGLGGKFVQWAFSDVKGEKVYRNAETDELYDEESLPDGALVTDGRSTLATQKEENPNAVDTGDDRSTAEQVGDAIDRYRPGGEFDKEQEQKAADEAKAAADAEAAAEAQAAADAQAADDKESTNEGGTTPDGDYDEEAVQRRDAQGDEVERKAGVDSDDPRDIGRRNPSGDDVDPNEHDTTVEAGGGQPTNDAGISNPEGAEPSGGPSQNSGSPRAGADPHQDDDINTEEGRQLDDQIPDVSAPGELSHLNPENQQDNVLDPDELANRRNVIDAPNDAESGNDANALDTVELADDPHDFDGVTLIEANGDPASLDDFTPAGESSEHQPVDDPDTQPLPPVSGDEGQFGDGGTDDTTKEGEFGDGGVAPEVDIVTTEESSDDDRLLTNVVTETEPDPGTDAVDSALPELADTTATGQFEHVDELRPVDEFAGEEAIDA